MADCEKTLRELEEFLDDELSDDARAVIHAHLDGCPDCFQAFDFQAELKAVIARKCREDVLPHGLMDRIRSCFDGAFEEPPATSADPAAEHPAPTD